MADTVYILLGSNLGDREKYLGIARRQLDEIEGFETIDFSSIYHSAAEAMPGENPPFLNQVVKAEYAFTPGALLATIEDIENSMGRTHKGKLQPRTIDLDILLFGQQKVATPRLTIPHKDLLNRPFAMVPLLEVEPNIIHPEKKKPVADYLTEQGRATVLLYKEHVSR